METKYKEVNGTSYHAETKQEIIDVLEEARQNKTRLRIYFGDTKTGAAWTEEHDIFGYIGRSTGTQKIPLLVANARSFGGNALLDHCIVKIKESKGKRVLYQHPKFLQPTIEIKDARWQEFTLGYYYSIHVNGQLYSNHKTRISAELLAKRLA